MTPELYHPVLDGFIRGLPHLFRDVEAPDGTWVLVEIAGDCGGSWYLSRELAGWQLAKQSSGECTARATIPQELAWRVFTKGISPESAREQIVVQGNRDLGERVLRLTAIVG